jgi:hypothetical protein
VAELVINGPPLNLFDAEMITDVESAIADVATRVRGRQARAMLLRAEGKVFCAGVDVDVHEFQGLSTAEGSRLMARHLSVVQGIEALPVPTLAVVHQDGARSRPHQIVRRASAGDNRAARIAGYKPAAAPMARAAQSPAATAAAGTSGRQPWL